MATNNIVGYHPVGAPHAYANRRWGNPARTQHSALLPATYIPVYNDHKTDKLWQGWGFRVSTWNIDSLTGRAGELVEALAERKIDVACVQETRWRGSGCRFFGAVRAEWLQSLSSIKTDSRCIKMMISFNDTINERSKSMYTSFCES